MKAAPIYQIVISGVGGQGVLFITRLLAEAAIVKRLPVFTSETHGMAQRGGTVISHLKVGKFASPLINPGRAGGIIALKAESLAQHGGYLTPGGWAVVNSPESLEMRAPTMPFYLDADRLAREIGEPRSVNLIMLGFTLSSAQRGDLGHRALHCSLDDFTTVMKDRLKGKGHLLAVSLRALEAGAEGVDGQDQDRLKEGTPVSPPQIQMIDRGALCTTGKSDGERLGKPVQDG